MPILNFKTKEPIKATKRDILGHLDEWKILNIFWQRSLQKWWIRAEKGDIQVEFYATTSEYKKYRNADSNREMCADVE